MKKIFSAALALVCVWFATPAHADLDPCRNLFDGTITHWAYTLDPNRVNVSPSYMGITLPVTENKTYTFSRATAVGNRFVRYFTTDVPVEGMAVYDVNPNIPIDTLTHTFTVPAGMKYVVFYFDVSGADISNSKIQLEEGTTATAYTPYNPLCATCDGTIVNYTSATGTVVQDGTPTPDNPIYPTFYQQGNMVLRKVGDIADSYDATTGKITRRVGVKVFDGTEDWGYNSSTHVLALQIRYNNFMITHFTKGGTLASNWGNCYSSNGYLGLSNANDVMTSLDQFKQWLASQYAAGTPVTIYYPLETETTEDWTETSYCSTPIKIATTKYNESAFGPLNTALQNAISVVDTVVSNTITQAGLIADLQAQKQTRPNDIADDSEKCPAGKKCLLVTDTSGVPHWYEIVERYSLLPDGYTELQWIKSTGTQYIDTGVVFDTLNTSVEIGYDVITVNKNLFGFNKIDTDKNWYTAYSSNGSVYIASSSKLTSFGEGTSGVKRDVIFTTTDQNKLTVKVNGSEVYNNSFNGTFITENQPSFAIFTTNGNLVDSRITSSRVWYTKLYKDNILVFNGIPAKNASGVVGMYDTVGGRFYTNAGTGEFIAGAPVSE